MEPEIMTTETPEITMYEKKVRLLGEVVEDLKNVLENKPITKAQRTDLETILPIWEDILSDYTCDKNCACEDGGKDE